MAVRRGAPAHRRRASRRVVDGFATFVTITKDGARLVKVDSSDLGVCGFEPGPLAETGAECDRQAKFFKVQVASLSDFALFRLDPVVPALRGWSIGAASVLHVGAGLLSQIHLKIRRRPE